MNISLSIMKLFPSASPLMDFKVQDDGEGPYIKEWNLIDPQPTEQELQAAWDIIKDLPLQKLPEQKKIDQLEAQLAQQNSQMTTFMEFVLSTMGVE